VPPAIKVVVRMEEVVESSVEEDDEDREEWELDPGSILAKCTKWNPDDQENEEATEAIALAYAPTAIQSLMREVEGAEFKFATTVALLDF